MDAQELVDDDGPLTLVDDSRLVGATVFGKLVADLQGRETPYNPETVRNWVKAGKCSSAGSDRRGKLFDPSHAQIVAGNVATPTKGGARRGAGRKRSRARDAGGSNGELSGEIKVAVEAKEAIEAFANRIANSETVDPHDAVHISELLNLTRQEMRAMLACYGTREHALSPAMMGVLRDWNDDRIKSQKYEERAGELVRRDDMVEAIARTQRPVLEMLNSLPDSLTVALAPHCWIGDGVIDAILSMLHHALREHGVQTRDPAIAEALDETRAMLARPASLESTLRALTSNAVRDAQAQLADSMSTTDQQDTRS